MNQMYAYSRDNRKIKFRMVSVQHFINEAQGHLDEPQRLIPSVTETDIRTRPQEPDDFGQTKPVV